MIEEEDVLSLFESVSPGSSTAAMIAMDEFLEKFGEEDFINAINRIYAEGYAAGYQQASEPGACSQEDRDHLVKVMKICY